MMYKGAVFAACVSAVALAPTLGAAADTYNFRLASGLGANHVSARATEFFAEKVKELSEDRISISLTYGGALLTATEVLAGVGDGRADLGVLSSAWHPGELPLTYLTTVPFITTNGEAAVRTLSQLYRTDEKFRAEYERQGVHALTFQPLDVLLMHGKTLFDTPASLKGKQIRGAGDWVNILPPVGAQPVSVAYTEIYESLDRGVMDGHGMNFEGIADLRVDEIAKYMADAGIGQVFAQPLVISSEIWEELPDEDKKIFEQAAAATEDEISRIYRDFNAPICDRMIKGGGVFFEWSQEDKDSWRNAAGQLVIDSWLDRQSNKDHARTFLANYQKLMDDYSKNATWKSAFAICKAKKEGGE